MCTFLVVLTILIIFHFFSLLLKPTHKCAFIFLENRHHNSVKILSPTENDGHFKGTNSLELQLVLSDLSICINPS